MCSKLQAILVMGLPGAGKTFFASKLAAKMSAVHLSSDQVRFSQIADRRYTHAEKTHVYDQLYRQTIEALLAYQSVIVDATFYLKEYRIKFFKGLADFGITPKIILIEASERTIRNRIRQKRPDSEADIKVYKLLRDLYEPVDEDKLILNTDLHSIEYCLDMAQKYIQDG